MSGSTTPLVVQVPGYPTSNRVPGAFAVVDATKANTATINQRSLIFGQMLPGGTATPNLAVISAGIGDAQAAFGSGSQLAIMVERYRAIDNFGELWCVPLSDASGATAAVGSIAFAGPATQNGTIPLYLDGLYVPVGVNNGDTATTIATNTAAAINAWTSQGGNPLPYNATASGSTVTLTATNKGTLGNQGTINFSFRGPANGEGQPGFGLAGSTNVSGVTAVITHYSGGATDPSLSTALAGLPAQSFDFICSPYSDSNSLGALTAFLSDATGRWNWSSELFGGVFTAKGGSFSVRTTWGTGLNDQHTSGIGAYNSPSPDWHWAIDYAAAAAVSLRADPSIPVGGLGGGVALNVVAPPLAYRDTFTEMNTLLYDGVSTYVVDQSGVVRVQRAITTYQKNAGGSPDNSYLNVNVPYQLMAFIRAWRSMILSNFNQVKLVSDGSRIPPGASMVTPSTIKFATIALYQQLATNGLPGIPGGLVQNPDQFAQQCQATNAGGGLVTMLLPVQLANQLINVAADVQFIQP